jgi:hypothetical protein
LVRIRLLIRESTIRDTPSVHVLVLRKSPVFFTPPTICAFPPKEDERPPLLGCCTMTTNINKKDTNRISPKTMLNVSIIIIYFVVIF